MPTCRAEVYCQNKDSLTLSIFKRIDGLPYEKFELFKEALKWQDADICNEYPLMASDFLIVLSNNGDITCKYLIIVS